LRTEPQESKSIAFGFLLWSLCLILPLVAAGYTLFQNQQSSHTYPAIALSHLTGQAAANTPGEAPVWRVDPQVDPPQKAIYGLFEIFNPGVYQVTFRLKLAQSTAVGQLVAHLRVNGAADSQPLVNQALRSEHFTEANRYHDFVLSFDNPRRQALSFEVDYLGTAPLVISQVTINNVNP
jgi:hypothetical protein